ncbi:MULTISPECIES: MBL fold metallo-hydrolase [Pedobacter]|uniref:Beta-lactamase domain protein n=1 Tax=Pedobacter heparinus (strain ATCC 13125 / DSM 2366 / CIP 104194 / JCM 7457 / NBRC 12017 / NCIMB 9290 / NRRL B-14731 / HIM 762-3) TaxID=485917 RepID=C6XX40_PEDHD|nr:MULTISPECIES: MBL fold metallo-hydrolase [Pedobacter]ACU06346.1 beta-lactamase domain protein [Pedobacter heparinus DSM 2366]MBB5437314.1 glyoxylase-like metal-dependent hydrolase (beta-lactamase superfamily II) [Pedobacter sp. AK017]
MISIQQFTFNPISENTYILFDETGECVIIDPGMYDAEEQNTVVKFIKEKKLKPVLLLNTHCHYDHVFGNKFVYDNWGLKPQFHKGELYVLQAMPGYVPQMGLHYELSPEPEVFLPESGKVNFGNSQLELIFAPGHSPAHLCFYAAADNFLIGGDVLFYCSIGRTDLPGGNHLQLINSIKNNLFILPDDCRVYPGHGQSTTIGFEKQHNPYLQ